MTLNKRELTLGHTYGRTYHINTDIITFGHYDMEMFRTDPETYSGIPLTADILTENLGFEEIEKYKHFDGSVTPIIWKKYPFIIEPFRFSKDGENRFTISRFVPARIGEYNFIGFLDYVHTAQNIVFDLTGQELEFKTKEG